jgi:hypothetical protein
MARDIKSPWATGPGEILRHGLDLLQRDSDVNRRLAMISIDNAVELMIKTYLGLPMRITGLEISRKAYDEFAQSFPKLLDALETYATDKINGIDLGEIEWYHRLRNELYHQGNGLTVERDKVEVYAELDNLLFENLFGFRLVEPEDDRTKLLGDFMAAWIDFERVLVPLQSETMRPCAPLDLLRRLRADAVVSDSELAEIDAIRRVRNEVIHGVADHKTALTRNMIERLRTLTRTIRERLNTDNGKRSNIPVERTAHSAGFFPVRGAVGCGPPLTGGVRGRKNMRLKMLGEQKSIIQFGEDRWLP